MLQSFTVIRTECFNSNLMMEKSNFQFVNLVEQTNWNRIDTVGIMTSFSHRYSKTNLKLIYSFTNYIKPHSRTNYKHVRCYMSNTAGLKGMNFYRTLAFVLPDFYVSSIRISRWQINLENYRLEPYRTI